MITEGTSVGFGLVWALDTVATVGSIPEPPAAGGQILKVALIVFGVGTLFYALVTVTEFFVAGHLAGLLEERRTLRMIDSLSDHILICGFGRVGRQVARDLRAARRRFVVLDNNPDETASTPRRWARRSSRARPPTTTCCARPGSCAPPG